MKTREILIERESNYFSRDLAYLVVNLLLSLYPPLLKAFETFRSTVLIDIPNGVIGVPAGE